MSLFHNHAAFMVCVAIASLVMRLSYSYIVTCSYRLATVYFQLIISVNHRESALALSATHLSLLLTTYNKLVILAAGKSAAGPYPSFRHVILFMSGNRLAT